MVRTVTNNEIIDSKIVSLKIKREQANLRISQAQHDLEFLNKEIARLESIKAQREEALSA